MRKIKGFLIGLFVMVCFIMLIAFFLPASITVSKSVLINASVNEVANQIRNFKNWKNWYPAFQNKEVTVTMTYSRASFANSVLLSGKNGKKMILLMVDSSMENVQINLLINNKVKSNYQFAIKPNGKGKTQVIWNSSTILGWYPWKKIQGIVMDKITGPQYVSTLQNLKQAAETHALLSLPK